MFVMADTILTVMEDAYSDRLICVCVCVCVSPCACACVIVMNVAHVMTDPGEGYAEPQSVSLS